MTASLPIVEVARIAASYQCTRCGALDSDGTSGPRYLLDLGGSYGARCDWHCEPCGRQVWSGYLGAKRDRLALVRLSWILGAWVRVRDLERWRKGEPERQVGLFG